MTTPSKKTLLFDLDGTLVDSFPGIRTSFLHTLQEKEWEIPSEDRISQVPGPPMEWTLQDLGMTAEQAQDALKTYLDHYGLVGWDLSEEFPGMRDLLIRLKKDGFRLCTATSKGEFFAEKVLRKFDMFDLFEFMGAATDNGTRRSKSAVIKHVLESVGLEEPADILMIGDRSHDIEGSAEFGIDCVGVTWGYGNATEWSAARFTASTAEELERIIHDWA